MAYIRLESYQQLIIKALYWYRVIPLFFNIFIIVIILRGEPV